MHDNIPRKQIMAKDFAEGFYGRTAWRKLAIAYRKKVCFCERCTKRGILGIPGEIVHHKIHLNKDNIKNPRISLNEANLELLCRECHEEEHKRQKANKSPRYRVDSLGGITIYEERQS